MTLQRIAFTTFLWSIVAAVAFGTDLRQEPLPELPQPAFKVIGKERFAPSPAADYVCRLPMEPVDVVIGSVPDVEVELVLERGDAPVARMSEISSGGEARFRLPVIPRGRYKLLARAGGDTCSANLEIGFPPPPQIIEVYDVGASPALQPRREAVIVDSNAVNVAVDRVLPGDQVIIWIDGVQGGSAVAATDAEPTIVSVVLPPVSRSYLLTATIVRENSQSESSLPYLVRFRQLGPELPVVQSIYECGDLPVPLIPGVVPRIRHERFMIELGADVNPLLSHMVIAYFDGEEVGRSLPQAGSRIYCIATEQGFPPGTYSLAVQVKGLDTPYLSGRSEPVAVLYQPTYVREMHEYRARAGLPIELPAEEVPPAIDLGAHPLPSKPRRGRVQNSQMPALDATGARQGRPFDASSRPIRSLQAQLVSKASPVTSDETSPPAQATPPTGQNYLDHSTTASPVAGNGRMILPSDPFGYLPLIEPMSAATSIDDFARHTGTSADSIPQSEEFVVDHRFDAPAHFPVPTFGLTGQPLGEEGAVIYEGMRFAVRQSGHYQVRFVVGSPAMPVTLRLQLVLEESASGRRYTLTLPPFTINPPSSRAEHRLGHSVHAIHHEGYLPVLDSHPGSLCVLRRVGTARFGYGVDVP